MNDRMKIFPVIIFIAMISISSASAQYWAKTYGEDQVELISKVLQTNDGGFILAGRDNGDDMASMLLKLDFEGNIQWQKKYEHTYWDLIQDIKQTSDGGYITAARSRPITTKPSNVWVLRLDGNGNIFISDIFVAITETELYLYTESGEAYLTEDGQQIIFE